MDRSSIHIKSKFQQIYVISVISFMLNKFRADREQASINSPVIVQYFQIVVHQFSIPIQHIYSASRDSYKCQNSHTLQQHYSSAVCWYEILLVQQVHSSSVVCQHNSAFIISSFRSSSIFKFISFRTQQWTKCLIQHFVFLAFINGQLAPYSFISRSDTLQHNSSHLKMTNSDSKQLFILITICLELINLRFILICDINF